jgi:type II secretory ATPase GspE/PulE/Tfp pilus assembly ATPase PilB-like protein
MSLTGHLVFSTLHTNDAAGAIARFVDINAPPLLLASCLNLIVAQRLVRKVCQRCRSAYEPPLELLEQLNLPATTAPTFYRGEGCVACNGTGFYGRTAIFEMLPITKDIRTLILRNSSTMDIQAQAEKEGMKTLRRAGIELALKGETSIEQVIAVTTEL